MNKDTALQREQTLARVKRYRERQKSVTKDSVTSSVTPLYDYDLEPAEWVMLHAERTQGQIDRFPMISLPFGRAYYEALQTAI